MLQLPLAPTGQLLFSATIAQFRDSRSVLTWHRADRAAADELRIEKQLLSSFAQRPAMRGVMQLGVSCLFALRPSGLFFFSRFGPVNVWKVNPVKMQCYCISQRNANSWCSFVDTGIFFRLLQHSFATSYFMQTAIFFSSRCKVYLSSRRSPGALFTQMFVCVFFVCTHHSMHFNLI